MNSVAWGEYRAPFSERLAFGAVRRRLAHGDLKRAIRRYLARNGFVADVLIDGIKMRCHVGDNYTERLLAEGTYQGNLESIQLITSSLKEGDVFVDVGANCGLFTLFSARVVGPAGMVVAIEPVPAMRDRLSFNVASNDFGNVRIVGNAVGAAAGELVIHSNPAQFGQSSLLPAEDSVPIKVQVKTLHDILVQAGASRVDALKIDIEGYEDRALVPFFATAPRELWPRRVLIEDRHKHCWERDVVGLMQSLGYETEWRGRHDALLSLAGRPAAV